MKEFLEAVAIAWNPIGQARRRIRSGTLTLGSVLVPFVAVVVACNLFAGGAQQFFFEAVLHAAGGEVPSHPLLDNDFARRTTSAIGVLVPVGAVALLPAGVFGLAGRSATLAAMVVVAASWSFYGAAVSAPVYFAAGTLAMADLELGVAAFMALGIPTSAGVVGLTLYFWLRMTLSVLELEGTRVFVISATVVVSGTLLAGAFYFATSASIA